jgi:hypothetical protein
MAGSQSNKISNRRPRKVRKIKQETTTVIMDISPSISINKETKDRQPETGSIPFEFNGFDSHTNTIINSSLDIKSKNENLLEQLDLLKVKLTHIFKSITQPPSQTHQSQ